MQLGDNIREVKGYPYVVSDKGEIWSLFGRNRFKRAYPLKLRCRSKRYVMVTLISELGTRKRRVALHRIIAETFIPNPGNLPEVNHKNGVKNDNRVENLEWCTHQQNIQHGWDNGFMSRTRPEELNIWQKRFVCESHLTQSELAKRYGVSQSLISKIRRAERIMRESSVIA